MSEKLIIGIDPDTDKSGVAILHKPSNELKLENLSFFEIFDLLNGQDSPLEVVLEAGWLNASNWHSKTSDGAKYASAIGNRTGRNHQVGILIKEMCEFLNIKYRLVKPTKSKTDAETFKRLSKYEGRTNQETRDAGMLVVGL